MASQLHVDVLASIPKATRLPNISELDGLGAAIQKSMPSAADTANYDEGIRALRAALLLFTSTRPARNLLVTSPLPCEGKSTVAAYLALTCAQAGKRVLLIDANFRNPTLHSIFALTGGVGLAEVTKRQCSYRDAIVRVDQSGLHLMTAGAVTRRAADLLSTALPLILAKVSQVFYLVIIDAPAVLGAPESLNIASVVDGVVLIAKAGKTTGESSQKHWLAFRGLAQTCLGS